MMENNILNPLKNGEVLKDLNNKRKQIILKIIFV